MSISLGHPTFYTRMEEKVLSEDDRELCPWIYYLPDPQPHLLNLKMIDNYSSYGEHGLRYVEKDDVYHEMKLSCSEKTSKLEDIVE